MVITKNGIELMGFIKSSDEDTLEAVFHMVNIYSIEGIFLEDQDSANKTDLIEFKENFKVFICDDINSALEVFFGFSIDNSEIDKLPQDSLFLIIHYSSEKTYNINGGYRKEENDLITTYDEFYDAKEDISNIEEEHLSSIITSVHVSISKINPKVKIVLKYQRVFGLTLDNKVVDDIKFSASFNFSTSFKTKINDLNNVLSASKKIKNKIDKRSGNNFHTAYLEKDIFKKFIYYYLFIEKYTHKTFKEIDKNNVSHINIPERIKNNGEKFFINQQGYYKNLTQRFNFCSMMVWDGIDDEDIDSFVLIKKVRDKISHGEDFSDSKLSIERIENLALKLLNQHQYDSK